MTKNPMYHIFRTLAEQINSEECTIVNPKELEFLVRDYVAGKIRKQFIERWNETTQETK